MPPNESLDRSCRLRASHQAGSAPRWVSLTGGNPVNSSVSLRRVGYCWRIQFQPRKLFKFGRIKRISSLFGEFANSIASALIIQPACRRFTKIRTKDQPG
jgi:hypothetical protein